MPCPIENSAVQQAPDNGLDPVPQHREYERARPRVAGAAADRTGMVGRVADCVGDTLELGDDRPELDPDSRLDVLVGRCADERRSGQTGRDFAEATEERPDVVPTVLDAKR